MSYIEAMAREDVVSAASCVRRSRTPDNAVSNLPAGRSEPRGFLLLASCGLRVERWTLAVEHAVLRVAWSWSRGRALGAGGRGHWGPGLWAGGSLCSPESCV
jgi:hypothetical protein